MKSYASGGPLSCSRPVLPFWEAVGGLSRGCKIFSSGVPDAGVLHNLW